MLDQNVFMETLREVKEIIRTAQEPLSEAEVLDYFKDMELSESHKQMVLLYLSNPEEEGPALEEAETETEVIQEGDSEEEPEMPDSKIFRMYLDELENLPKFSDAELSSMYIKLLRGDSEVIQNITNGWMRRVVDVSRKFISPKYNLEDVIQEGNMGLFVRLTELCGCNEAVNVEEALLEAVEASMKAYISEITGEDDSEQTVVGKANLINEARKYLAIEKGSEPTPEEIAAYTGLDIEELSDIIEIITKAEKK